MRIDLLLFAVGVAILQNCPVLPSLGWTFSVPFLFFVAMSIPQKLFREVLLKSAFLLAGFFYAAILAQIRISDALPVAWEGRDVDLTGVVADLPQTGETGQRFLFDVERTETPGAAVPKKILLAWYFGPEMAEVHPGQRWRFTARLRRPHGNSNPHGFDYEAWLMERGIRATGYVRRAMLEKEFVARPDSIVEAVREKLRSRVVSALPDSPYAGVIAALLMGEQQAISQDDWKIFRRTGVIHLMSISGLHVTMIAAFFAFLVHRLWGFHPPWLLALPARKASALAGLFAAFSYALLAGYAVPTQRTVYMLAVVAVALWSGRMSSPSSILCWALLAVTLLDPWAVLSPGFWLSFFAVALILYVGTGRVGQAGGISAWASAQWAVSIGLAPLLLLFFQQISLISPIANAIAIPVVSLVVVPLTLLGAVLPFDLPFVLAEKTFSAFMHLLSKMSALPDAVWTQHSPPLWTLVAALAGIGWVLLPRGFPARWLGFFWIAPMFLVFPEKPEWLRLTVLDVGQGLAAVVQTRHHALLFDAGPAFTAHADSGNRIVLPFLIGEGVTRLDGMILSHEDIDHAGGAVSVLDSIPVDWLLSSLPQGSPALSRVRSSMSCRSGQSWTWDDIRFEILSPQSSSYSDPRIKSNARSCVLKATSREGTFLIAGDIDERRADRLAMDSDVRADVLVVPHHGGKSSEKFARAVSPRYAVFSVGYRNRFRHPRRDVLAVYEGLGSRIFRTDLDGALAFDFSPSGIRETSWREKRRRYWIQEK